MKQPNEKQKNIKFFWYLKLTFYAHNKYAVFRAYIMMKIFFKIFFKIFVKKQQKMPKKYLKIYKSILVFILKSSHWPVM